MHPYPYADEHISSHEVVLVNYICRVHFFAHNCERIVQTVTENSQTSDSYEPILFNESVKQIYKTVSNSSVSVQIPMGSKQPCAIIGLNFIKFACPLLNISYL